MQVYVQSRVDLDRDAVAAATVADLISRGSPSRRDQPVVTDRTWS
jgi:hypothetical protein